jgi:hypothetical protein
MQNLVQALVFGVVEFSLQHGVGIAVNCGWQRAPGRRDDDDVRALAVPLKPTEHCRLRKRFWTVSSHREIRSLIRRPTWCGDVTWIVARLAAPTGAGRQAGTERVGDGRLSRAGQRALGRRRAQRCRGIAARRLVAHRRRTARGAPLGAARAAGVPLLGALLVGMRLPKAVALVWLGAAGYVALIVFTFVQALQGVPFLAVIA